MDKSQNSFGCGDEHKNHKDDIFRDSPLRYMGYANEVGESFRALVPVIFVRLSYVAATGYVLADTLDKSANMYRLPWSSTAVRYKKVFHSAADTMVWQMLASVIIPGFTINRICVMSLYLMRKTRVLSPMVSKWSTTAVGLGCIPLIIKPIDNFVDVLLDTTFRKWFKISEDEEGGKPSH
ncbi:MTFP1 (predicted) [Pycnogonum litorale]